MKHFKKGFMKTLGIGLMLMPVAFLIMAGIKVGFINIILNLLLGGLIITLYVAGEIIYKKNK